MGGKKKWELSAAASKSDNSVESYQHSQATSLKNSLSLSLSEVASNGNSYLILEILSM